MAWTLKLVTMLKKCTISINSVSNSVISFDIMFIWQISDWICRICMIPRLWLFNVFVLVHIMLRYFLTSFLCLDNTTTRSETLIKTVYLQLRIKCHENSKLETAGIEGKNQCKFYWTKPSQFISTTPKFISSSHGQKVTLPHGCFSRFLIVQMVPNSATHHIWTKWKNFNILVTNYSE